VKVGDSVLQKPHLRMAIPPGSKPLVQGIHIRRPQNGFDVRCRHIRFNIPAGQSGPFLDSVFNLLGESGNVPFLSTQRLGLGTLIPPEVAKGSQCSLECPGLFCCGGCAFGLDPDEAAKGSSKKTENCDCAIRVQFFIGHLGLKGPAIVRQIGPWGEVEELKSRVLKRELSAFLQGVGMGGHPHHV